MTRAEYVRDFQPRVRALVADMRSRYPQRDYPVPPHGRPQLGRRRERTATERLRSALADLFRGVAEEVVEEALTEVLPERRRVDGR